MSILNRKHLPISRALALKKEEIVMKFRVVGKAVYLERQLICDCADELKASLVCEALNHTCAPSRPQQSANQRGRTAPQAPTGRVSHNVTQGFRKVANSR